MPKSLPNCGNAKIKLETLSQMQSADDVIALLDLAPHPEGGYFRETFRDDVTVKADGGDRAAQTAIYFLLAAGQRSHWHKVDAAEIWHWYAGAALKLSLAGVPGTIGARQIILGPDLFAGERPQAVVAKGVWQSAQSLGAWTLVGCTVAPGFTFEGFELAAPGFDPAGQSPHDD